MLAVEPLEAVERSGIGETFDCLLVAGSEVDAFHEVEYILVLTVLLALGHDSLHGILAHSLHAAQAEAYIALAVRHEVQS